MVINREEGFVENSENAEDDDLDEDVHTLLIDHSINFHYSITSEFVSFFWRDPSCTGMLFEYRIPSKLINKPMIDYVETKILECMYERSFRKSSDIATAAELETLKFRQVHPRFHIIVICLCMIVDRPRHLTRWHHRGTVLSEFS
jgi:hypothetical protein